MSMLNLSFPFYPRSVFNKIGLTLLAAATLIFLWESRRPIPQLDDAFISYRYAANLVHNHQLVFNIGEYVEGYTNLLWTLMIAAGVMLGIAAPTVGYLLGVICGSSLLVASYVYTAGFLPHSARWLAGFAPLALLSFNSFACWTSAGMETPLFALLTIGALHSFREERPYRIAILCILSTMTRPDGIVLAGFLLVADFLRRVTSERNTNTQFLFFAARPGFLFAAYLIIHTVFRLYYYDDLVPNTFYAKVGDIPLRSGFIYLRNFFVDGPAFLIPGFVIATFSLKTFRIPTLFVITTITYVVWIGGDVFRLGRFLLPLLPIMIAGSIAGTYVVFEKNRAAGIALASTIALASLTSLYGFWPGSTDFYGVVRQPFPISAKRIDARRHEFFINEDRLLSDIGEIKSITPPVKLIAAIGIGKLGYFSGTLPILDLVGLTDRHIARSRRTLQNVLVLPGHSRTDSDYVLSRRPDIILIPRKDSISSFTLPAVVDLWRNPRLEREYFWDKDHSYYRIKPGIAQANASTLATTPQ